MKKYLFLLVFVFLSSKYSDAQHTHFFSANYSYYGKWDPFERGGSVSLDGTRLKGESSGALGAVLCDIGVSGASAHPLVYCEIKCISGLSGYVFNFGVANASLNLNNECGFDADGWGYRSVTGEKFHSNSNTSFGSSYGVGDIVMIALDMTNGYVYFGVNGTWQNGASSSGIASGSGTGAAFSGLTGTLFFCGSSSTTVDMVWQANFGAASFVYTPPSGFAGVHH